MSMAHIFSSHLVWTGAADGGTVAYDAYSREYLIEIDGKPPLRGSSAPIYRGNPGLHNPEDLLVAALSSCHMLWYLHLCATAGIEVIAYEDDATGTLTHQQGKMSFSEVCLRPRVTIARGELQKAVDLHRRAHGECFIANSVNFPVRHEATIEMAGGS